MEDDACLDQLLFLLFRSGCLVRHCNEKATLKIVSPFLSFLTRAALFDIYNSHPPCSLFFAFLLSIPLCHSLPKPTGPTCHSFISYQSLHSFSTTTTITTSLIFSCQEVFHFIFQNSHHRFFRLLTPLGKKSLSVLQLHHRTFVPLQPMPSLPRLDPTK